MMDKYLSEFTKFDKPTSISLILACVSYPIFCLLYYLLNRAGSVGDEIVYLLSLCGLILIAFQMITYKKSHGTWLTLYTIFLVFFTVFNFGECLFWVFGIHLDSEISVTRRLYGYITPTYQDIAKAQLLFIECSIILHASTIMNHRSGTDENSRTIMKIKKDSSLFNASLLVFLISAPLSYYYVIMKAVTAQKVGYQALYYTDALSGMSDTVPLINKMFFPSLVGLLIGSGYKTSIRKLVYIVFGIYAFIDLMCGDRGGWIYSLIILVWMHNRFCNKINSKRMIALSVVAFILISVTDAIVSVRNTGINAANIINELTNADDNPVISSIFGMGYSMGVNVVVLKDTPHYPYGNSYLMAILGCVSTKIPQMFGLSYSTPTKWFSQEYMHISWGAGFTVISEAVINVGAYFAPLIFCLFGLIFRDVLDSSIKNEEPIRIFIHITITTFLLGLSRSTTHEFLKNLIVGLLPIIILIYYFKMKSGYDLKSVNNLMRRKA